MIVTEEQAKTKRCQEGFGQPIFNSQLTQTASGVVSFAMGAAHGAGYAAVGSPSHCIGSTCMAWVWVDEPDSDQPRGFCGKAGA